MENLFKAENRVPDAQWVKLENVDDTVGGVIKNIFKIEKNGAYEAQRGFVFVMEDGTEKTFAIKRTQYYLNKTNHWRIGSIGGFKLDKILPPKIKGYKPTKCYEPFYIDKTDVFEGPKAHELSAEQLSA